MFEKRVIPGKTYCVFSPGNVMITAKLNGTIVNLINESEIGKYYFIAPTTKINSSIDLACIIEASAITHFNKDTSPLWLYALRATLKECLSITEFKIELDDTKLIVHTDRADDAQLEEVAALLERVLPQNIEVVQYNQSIDIPWRDWTPGFKQVEYLESTGTQYIDTGIYLSDNVEVACDLQYASTGTSNYIFGNFSRAGAYVLFGTMEKGGNYSGSLFWLVTGDRSSGCSADVNQTDRLFVEIKDNTAFINGNEVYFVETNSLSIGEEKTLALFARNHKTNGLLPVRGARMWSFVISYGGQISNEFVPCLDETGSPCMYDTVTRKAYYNRGSGDFLYPGAEQAAAAIMTLDLDAKFYAKLTATGVRRLYHVPAGCNMTMDEYAAANGFKELVEPPMPLEGYWTPEWRETDTQIICDWVETEPPAEEI